MLLNDTFCVCVFVFITDVSKIKAAVPKFTLPYDYLVVAIGSVPNTFNIPGVKEYAHFLKSVEGERAHILSFLHSLSLV
jgi:NADH dehydrogenase FAD-containing subunit